MTETRRKTLFNMIAIAVLIISHGGLIVGLALAGEWRVWRFITNLVFQLDALILVLTFAWLSIAHHAEWRLSTLLTVFENTRAGHVLLDLLGRVVVIHPGPPPLIDFTETFERRGVFRWRSMFALLCLFAVSVPDRGWSGVCVAAICLIGFVVVGLTHWRDRLQKPSHIGSIRGAMA